MRTNSHTRELLEQGQRLVLDDDNIDCGRSNVGPYLMAKYRKMRADLRALPGSDQFDDGKRDLWGVGSILALNPSIDLFPEQGQHTRAEELEDFSHAGTFVNAIISMSNDSLQWILTALRDTGTAQELGKRMAEERQRLVSRLDMLCMTSEDDEHA